MKTTGCTSAHAKLFCAAMLLLASAVAQAAGIAFVTDLKGEPKTDSAKLTLLTELNRGQRIVCAEQCTVGVMYLQSGKEFEVKGPGEYLVGDNEVTAKIGVPPAVRDTAWRVSGQTVVQATQTSGASVRMRGIKPPGDKQDAQVDRLLFPVKTKVSSLTPLFHWETATARAPYEFELTGPGGKPLYKTRTSATSMWLPGNVKLSPETTYSWTVNAAGTTIGSESFTTLSSQLIDQLKQNKPGEKAVFADWVAYALTLQDLGASQDAREVWGKLSKERPDLPELAALAK